MLRAELPTAGKTCSISVHMLLCKCVLPEDVARRALGLFCYSILLAMEGLLTSFLLLHKAPANLVSMVIFTGPLLAGTFAACCT